MTSIFGNFRGMAADLKKHFESKKFTNIGVLACTSFL